MRFRIVFSIPVHERFEVVLDQVLNVLTCNSGCGIVLHLSASFNVESSWLSKEGFLATLTKIGIATKVMVNPVSLKTSYGDIIHAHLANFSYASKMADFEYFAMLSSNELFIREGLYSHISRFDCGVGKKPVRPGDKWVHGQAALRDPVMYAFLEELGGESVFSSQVEGSFYRKEIFAKISEIIVAKYSSLDKSEIYAREELYFPTVFWNLAEKGAFLVWQHCFTFTPWDRGSWSVKLSDVAFFNKHPEKGKYSVKRVDRILEDPVRSSIRQKLGYFRTEKALFPGLRRICAPLAILRIYLANYFGSK